MTAGRPSHWPMLQFPVIDDCLWIGGLPLTQLAARVGQTPFYAYDRRVLGERAAHYAVKANPMPALVQHMAGLVDGLDVASLGELKVALDTGMDPARISFAGPGKRLPELA
nr:pyridoxal-dependent decarboxylase, exosortase A system-associated [Candidatus Contendobacter sp.]